MQKRHTPTIPVQFLEIAPPVHAVTPCLSAAKLKRAAKLRGQLEALKKELAQVLNVVKKAEK